MDDEYNDADSDIDSENSEEITNYEFEEYIERNYNKEIKIKNNIGDSSIKIISYNFQGIQLLKPILSTNVFKNIEKLNLCIYNITNTLKYPLINYYLQKGKNNDLEFPFILNNNINLNFYDIILKYIHDNGINNCDIERFIKGYYIYNSQYFIFIDFTEEKNKNKLNEIYKSVYVDELINTHNKYEVKINDDVCVFFINNLQFVYLYDLYNKTYEIPVVVYMDLYNEEKNFCLAFNKLRSTKRKLLGSAYYFTTYHGSICNVNENECFNNMNINNKKAYIARVILFLGKQNILLNYPNDKIDYSDCKKDLLMNGRKYEKYICYEGLRNYRYCERMNLKISDYDSLWVDEYDSVYLGILKLDDDTYTNNYPLWIVKSTEQFKIIDVKEINSIQNNI